MVPCGSCTLVKTRLADCTISQSTAAKRTANSWSLGTKTGAENSMNEGIFGATSDRTKGVSGFETRVRDHAVVGGERGSEHGLPGDRVAARISLEAKQTTDLLTGLQLSTDWACVMEWHLQR